MRDEKLKALAIPIAVAGVVIASIISIPFIVVVASGFVDFSFPNVYLSIFILSFIFFGNLFILLKRHILDGWLLRGSLIISLVLSAAILMSVLYAAFDIGN